MAAADLLKSITEAGDSQEGRQLLLFIEDLVVKASYDKGTAERKISQLQDVLHAGAITVFHDGDSMSSLGSAAGKLVDAARQGKVIWVVVDDFEHDFEHDGEILYFFRGPEAAAIEAIEKAVSEKSLEIPE